MRLAWRIGSHFVEFCKKGGVAVSSTQVLSQRIRHYRKTRSMTQKQLATALGCAPRYITQIEQGLKGPSLDKLVAICKWFGISLADLLPIEEQDDVVAREQMILEIVEALKGLDTTHVSLMKTIVCAFSV